MHTLICGVTMTGKTTLAHYFASLFAGMGHNVIVFDPIGTRTASGSWPESAVIFDEPTEFMEYMNNSDVKHAHVFIDEADEVFSLSQRENYWLLKKGRHFGLFIYLITQRPKMVAPTCRKQCGKAYLFRLAMDDMREIAADYGHSDIHKIPLDTGDCIGLLSGRSAIERFNVFNIVKITEE